MFDCSTGLRGALVKEAACRQREGSSHPQLLMGLFAPMSKSRGKGDLTRAGSEPWANEECQGLSWDVGATAPDTGCR